MGQLCKTRSHSWDAQDTLSPQVLRDTFLATLWGIWQVTMPLEGDQAIVNLKED